MATNAKELQDQVTKDLAAMQGQDPIESYLEEDSAPAEETNLWADMAGELENDEDDIATGIDEATPEKKEVTPPKAEAKPVEPTPPVVSPTSSADPAPVAPAAVVPPAPVVTPEPVAPATPPQVYATPEEIKAARGKAVDELAKRYTLSEDEADELVRSPETAYPKFAAKLFMDVFEAVAVNMQKTMPSMIQQVNDTQSNQQKAENAFYSANPQLDRAKHADTVNRIANVYVQLNPKATKEQIFKDVGVQAMYMLGINPVAPTAASAAPAVPSTPPYTPAGAGNTASRSVKAAGNEWSQMADELLSEDD